jgi:small subunit ribosomal protein S1
MANEVNNETEESVKTDSAVVEETKNETPATEAETVKEVSAEETVPEETTNSNDIDFGAILEQFEQEQTVFHSGELVKGKVVGISDRGVLVDFGYKSEGIVSIDEFTLPNGEVTVKKGDEVEVIIRSIHSGDAPPQLSHTDAISRAAWSEIEAAFNSETPIVGRVIDKTKGGLRVDINGVEAFLPGSQIDSRPIRGLDSYKGEEIEAKIIKFSRRRNNIVLSRKVLTDAVVNEQKAETLNNVEVGYVVEGTIKNLTDYGAFVDIGGIDGLLHVTDMSWGRLNRPSDVFKAGDTVQVKILKLDREKEKVSLGYKQLLPDPWSTVVEVYPVDSKLKGKVSSVTDYGVFVELEPGVEGLVHVSEVSWSKRSKTPKRMFKNGDEVDVQVLGVDTDERRISLGMKQLQENPWDTVDQKYSVGSKVRGKVRNLTDFGAFVELEDGIDGLVHISDITWDKKIKHPKDVLKKDDEVDAIVTSIDKRGQRLSLSIKELTPSAWESFVATHRAGDVVRGKISRFAGFGVFVELVDGLEGLCHISELSDERVERAEEVVKLGQEMDFKILRIEHDNQKIGLSARAVGKEDEPVVDTRMYTSEAKGGMASLGELANLKFSFNTPAEEVKEEPKKDKKAEKAEKAEKAKAEPVAQETETETAVAAENQAETTSESTEVVSETSETVEETPATEETAEVAPEAKSDAAEETTETVAEEVTAETEETVAPEPTTEADAEAQNPETAQTEPEEKTASEEEEAEEKTA